MKLGIKNLILDILLPKKCLGCGKEGSYICSQCDLFLLDLPVFSETPVLSFWEYNGLIKKAIHLAKYCGGYDILRELVNKKDFELKENTIITFVPMHIKEKRKRGFNQSEIIAQEIGKKTGMSVVKLLEKIKETPEQAKLNREERLQNLKESFISREVEPLGDKSVLLVDDVYTTGATMLECVKTLNKAGYKNIQCFTLAKTI